MIGRTLSHYKITGKLGEGGMGEVYIARDTELDRVIALKVLPSSVADDPERLERFQREAKAIAALNHPNIVTIHSIEKDGGRHFITMELVEGESLDRILPAEGFPLAKVFDIAIPLTDALSVAHRKGIVHRDLKPANIMLTRDDRVKVLDFGLAKLSSDTSGKQAAGGLSTVATEPAALTGVGTVLGTAPYMSPEQVEGRTLDHRTDIFSLGVVLYEMVTGHRPFQGDSSPGLMSSILRDTPPEVTAINRGLPRHMGRIIQHCLEKVPTDRYQSALDVCNELRSLRAEVESGSSLAGGAGARGAGSGLSIGRRSRKSVWIAAGLAAAAILVAGWWMGRETERSPAPGNLPASAGPAPGDASPLARPAAPSVAVLPFSNLSPDPENEYFTDGLTEELIQALSKVEGLRIPARTSVFALKGTNLDVQEIGERLGVENIIEGSVRKSGNRLRISAQLIKVADGFNLWSETYDRKLEDVFAIQDEIAGNIAEALQLTLSPGEQRAIQTERPTDSRAYDYYLRGRGYFRRRTRGDFESARKMFSKAIDVDPSYAPAYAGLADSYTEFWRNYETTDENLQRADEASLQAVKLDSDLAEAHASRGFALGQQHRYDEAEREFRHAIKLNPRLFEAYYYFGTVAFSQGELTRAAEMFELASKVAPDERRALQLLPQVYRSLGREAEVESTTRRRLEVDKKRLEFDPDDIPTLIDGASALAILGERERSTQWAARVLETGTDDALVLYNLACVYSLAHEPDSAFDALERSFEAGLADPDWMRQDSDLDNIRDDPRFEALLKRMEVGK
ncbi:MAG: protein kinase [Acidobacteriota bacterium]